MKKILRDYQKEAIRASRKRKRGIICLPTGSGKSMVQSYTLIEDMRKNPGHRVYLILAPRIVLSYQLMKDYYSDLNEEGLESWYAGLHSGGSVEIQEFEERRSEDIDFQEIIVSTNSQLLKEEVEKAKNLNIPIIIFGTYHSAERMRLIIDTPVDITICDEAHYLISDQFEDLVKFDGLNSDKIFFYTATMQTTASENGKGMNNTRRFGNLIYHKIPREMIDAGYMVRPRMHIIKFDKNYSKEELIEISGEVVAESFRQHEYIAQRTGKIFITCTGTPMMKSILASSEIRQLKRRRGVKVYAIASDPSIGNQIDGVQYKRSEFLRILKEDGLNNAQEMIILHIDILTEGIDVPGITGILPFRSLRKSKFIQTLGRASRVSVDDLESFANKEYTHNDLEEMAKPYAWIMLPDIDGEDTAEEFRELVRELRTYTFDPNEDVFISNEAGQMPPVILMDPVSKPDIRSSHIQAVLFELNYEIEEKLIADLLNPMDFDSRIELEDNLHLYYTA